MQWILFAVLIAVAWYAMETGTTFLAFLSIAGIVLLLFTQNLSSKERTEYPPEEKEEPNKKSLERPVFFAGYALNNIGRSLYYLIFGYEKKK
ncbi:MAG: hypothetical protein ABH803_01295 [Candidatus Micrarchaeota archaeon]